MSLKFTSIRFGLHEPFVLKVSVPYESRSEYFPNKTDDIQQSGDSKMIHGALVVVESTETNRELLREAGVLAEGVDAELVLLTLLDQSGFEQDIEVLDRIATEEHTTYSPETVFELAKTFADELVESELSGIDVEYQSVGAVIDSGT